MPSLGKSLSAQRNVRPPTVARPLAALRQQRPLFLRLGEVQDECLVEEMPIEAFGGRRHALHVLCIGDRRDVKLM
jgi:hypothetical protein